MKFKSPRERYEWLVKTGAADDIMKFKECFGEIKLSNVGKPPFPRPPEVKNLWEGFGLKCK